MIESIGGMIGLYFLVYVVIKFKIDEFDASI